MPYHLKTRQEIEAKNAPLVDVSAIVKGVIDTIRAQGDAAVLQYSQQFDSWTRPTFRLSQEEIEAAMSDVSEQTIKDIKEVQANVRKFAEAQKASLQDFEIEMEPGVFLGQKNTPINRVGW